VSSTRNLGVRQNITTKPKSFENKQIVVFMLCVMLMTGL